MADYRARLSENLRKRIEKIVESDEYSYKSKNEFVQEATRKLLDEIEMRQSKEELKKELREELKNELL